MGTDPTISAGPTDVSNAPLDVVIDFYSRAQNYVHTKAPLEQFLPLAPPDLQGQLAPLRPYLTIPLGTKFNSLWQSVQVAQELVAVDIFEAQAKSSGHSVSNVKATLPPSGILTADTQPVILPEFPTPCLYLVYLLSGCNFYFETDLLGGSASYNLGYDLSVLIGTPAPLLPFGFTPTVSATILNANLQADNLWANVVAFADDFFTDLGNFFANGRYESYVDEKTSALDALVDGAHQVNIGTQFLTLLTSLNAAGPQIVPYGFTECWFSIENDSTLTLTILHPFDPGPTLENVNDPQANQVLTSPPTLSVSDTQVKPGAAITVSGDFFPVETMTQLAVQWPNTSSGTPTDAQVKYEIDGQDTASPIEVPLPGSFQGRYTYTAKGLVAGKQYNFWARCGDALTWSKWSASPLSIKTLQTNLVNLVLTSLDNPSIPAVVVGHSELSGTSNQWSSLANIPSSTAAGTYSLSAELSGTVLASITITIAEILLPILQMIDPTTGRVVLSPVLYGGSPFTVRGENFPVGKVTVTLNGTTVGAPNAPNGEFMLSLTVPGDPNSDSQAITLTAIGGGRSATLSFQTFGTPK